MFNNFKKRRIPWNKGKRGLQVAWNKGKKSSKETIEKQRIAWKKAFMSNPEVRKKLSESQLKRVDRNEGENQSIDSNWAKLIGYLLSDEYWGKGQTLKFVNNNVSFIEEVKKLAKEKGFFIRERTKN
ncbi:MAG: hypothetical protein AABW56_02045, partial [Nanoarchaeota archaeon]